MGSAFVFKPPYLRYSVPAEKQQIQQAIQALITAVLKTKTRKVSVAFEEVRPGGLLGARGLKPDAGNAAMAADSTVVGPQRTRSAGQPVVATPAPGSTQGSVAAKTGQQMMTGVMVSPVGPVKLGFNCRETFTAQVLVQNASHLVWTLEMKNPQTGQYDEVFFLGAVSSIVTPAYDMTLINFDHDFSSYKNTAYASTNKKAVFRVACTPWLYADELATATSGDVTLDFAAPTCLGIHSLSLSRKEFKGGNNGSEPTLTVNLDGPAGPGGQKVALSVDNNNLGNIMGSGWFMIEQGHTSGQLSWFLGTRKVLQTRTLKIKVELVDPSGHSGPAWETVTLKK